MIDNQEFSQKITNVLKNGVLGIYGQSGSGKTTALKKIIQGCDLPKLNKKTIVLSGARIDILKYKNILFHPGKMVQEISELKDNESIFINVCNPNVLELAIGCCLILHNTLLIIDDLEGYLESKSATSYITNLMSYHRHKDCAVVFTSRRPQSVPTLLVFNSQVSIVFKCTEPNSLQALASNFPNVNGENTKDLISGLNFSEHECYIYADGLNMRGKF